MSLKEAVQLDEEIRPQWNKQKDNEKNLNY